LARLLLTAVHTPTHTHSYLEDRQPLPLFLYGESRVRVEDDGRAGGLSGQISLLTHTRSLWAWKTHTHTSRSNTDRSSSMFTVMHQ